LNTCWPCWCTKCRRFSTVSAVGRKAAPARRHLQEIAARSIDFADEIDEARAIVGFAGGLQQHGARAVAEQDAGGPVRVVDDPAHGIGADDQDFAVRAGRDQGGPGRQAVQKTGTGGDQVEAPGPVRAQAILDQARGGRKQHVGRHRANQNGVQFGARDAAGGQRHTRGLGSHVGGGHFRSGDVPLADARAFHDPFAVGVDHPLQIFVGEHARRHIAAQRADFHFRQVSSKAQMAPMC
jgi:hypothetical protein